MFELFNVPATPVAIHSDLSPYAARRTAGIVMDSSVPSNSAKGKYDESGPPGAHDAVHVRGVQRARHARGDPGPTTLFECTELSWEA